MGLLFSGATDMTREKFYMPAKHMTKVTAPLSPGGRGWKRISEQQGLYNQNQYGKRKNKNKTKTRLEGEGK